MKLGSTACVIEAKALRFAGFPPLIFNVGKRNLEGDENAVGEPDAVPLALKVSVVFPGRRTTRYSVPEAETGCFFVPVLRPLVPMLVMENVGFAEPIPWLPPIDIHVGVQLM